MGARFERGLRQVWASRGPLAWLLWPLSRVYGLLWWLRQRSSHAPEHLPVPVVVVGNVIAGGAGKTPVTLAVVRDLQAHGWTPGVVSRGYGRRSQAIQAVTPESLAGDTGDEPLLIARSTGVPVWVGARRVEAARAMLAARPAVDVIVCDDGLQHRALARDVELVVFDDRGTGNGWLLPAGPLREPWPRPASAATEIVVHTTTRRLADRAVNRHGHTVVLDSLAGQHVAALAGIARPEAFFGMLQARGLTLARTLPLPDHAELAAGWPELRQRLHAAPLWLCTEKDAVKLFPLLRDGDPEVLAVPLVVELAPEVLAQVRLALSSRS